MYSKEERKRAIDLLLKYDLCFSDTIAELGYPDYSSLRQWYADYIKEQETGIERPDNPYVKYTQEQKETAVDYYNNHGRSISRTIRVLGYPSRVLLVKWIKEISPDTRKLKRKPLQYSQEQKRQAVVDLCSREGTAEEIAQKYGADRASIYAWKRQLLGEENTTMSKNKSSLESINTNLQASDTIETLSEEIKKLKKQNDKLRQDKAKLLEQTAQLEKDKYRKQLELDVLEKAVEIIKKEQGISILTLTNREKAIVIDALRDQYSLKELLLLLQMAKSSYCYQVKAMKKDKYVNLRTVIINIFTGSMQSYGYRRIHMELKNKGIHVSEKVVRHIMRDNNLVVPIKRRKKYNSYKGEITPAVPNLIERNFRADKPNTKWLTDITEFHIPAGKVYLSPIIDCFDGLPVSWTIGTSPDAELVNTMLEDAISQLKDGEKPIIHSDRGCHYRWDGWIDRMNAAGLSRSMSKKGCSPDNSACEGFFGRLKNEMFYCRSWANVSISEFIDIVDKYIQWYAEKRIKLSLGGMSPLDYRRSLGLAL